MTNIAELAATPELLVISDFDGTLAGFNASDIYDVPIHPDSLRALETLAELPHTSVAILSGRHLAGLREVCPLQEPVVFAGSHGAETSGEPSGEEGPSPEIQEKLSRLDEELAEIKEWEPRTYLEKKPFQRVVHVMALAGEDAERAAEVCSRALSIDPQGLSVEKGKNIVEFSASSENKGSWIAAHKESFGATAAIFLGDDTTDEAGFSVLGPDDLGVKVGAGDTAAQLRVEDRDEVAQLLTELAAQRTRWANSSTR